MSPPARALLALACVALYVACAITQEPPPEYVPEGCSTTFMKTHGKHHYTHKTNYSFTATPKDGVLHIPDKAVPCVFTLASQHVMVCDRVSGTQPHVVAMAAEHGKQPHFSAVHVSCNDVACGTLDVDVIRRYIVAAPDGKKKNKGKKKH